MRRYVLGETWWELGGSVLAAFASLIGYEVGEGFSKTDAVSEWTLPRIEKVYGGYPGLAQANNFRRTERLPASGWGEGWTVGTESVTSGELKETRG